VEVGGAGEKPDVNCVAMMRGGKEARGEIATLGTYVAWVCSVGYSLRV